MKEKKVQRRYDEEFKRQAVELVIHSGRTQAQIARELGVSEYSLTLWKRAYLGHLKPAQLDGEQLSSEHKGRYGSPRITQQLRQEGVACGENRVARLMRENELTARRNKAFRPRTTLPGEGAAPNLTALRNALVLRQPDEGLYFHSDRGSQYSSQAVRKPLSVIGANLSMSGVGNCYDNAQAEAFFSALGYKAPCQYETELKRVIDSEIDLAQGIDVATEDRALRGRTSSADAALQTAGAAAYEQPTGPGPVPAGASPKRKIPGGSGDRVTRFLR